MRLTTYSFETDTENRTRTKFNKREVKLEHAAGLQVSRCGMYFSIGVRKIKIRLIHCHPTR